MADFKPIIFIICFYRCYNRAYPLLYYIPYRLYVVGLMYNVLGKPAIFLRGRYVASDIYYFKYDDIYINEF